MSSFKYDRVLQWSECDPAGIIFFPNYMRWMVDGVNRMLLSAGIDPNESGESGEIKGLPAVKVSADFSEPLRLYQAVTHQISVKRIGTSSVVFEHRFLKEGTCVASGEDMRVRVSHAAGGNAEAKSQPFSVAFRNVLSRYVKDDDLDPV
jgi:acyl-CoA thioesterase FadM